MKALPPSTNLLLPATTRILISLSSTLSSFSTSPKHSIGRMAQEECTKESSDSNASSNGSTGYADRIIPHLLNLYGTHPAASDFEIYAPNATFEDPLMCARGVKQIKSAFYSIGKIFSESQIVEFSVEEKVASPGKHEILIDSKQHYKFLGKNIDMVSLIVLSVEGGKVIRHEDRWNKKPLPNRETIHFPLVGRFLEMSRRGSMLATHAMMGFGKDPST